MNEPRPVVDARLLGALVAVASGLDLEPTLRRIVDASAELTGARFAALGILGDDGLHTAFVHRGFDDETIRVVGAPPRGRGVLGYLTRVGQPLMVDDLTAHPSSTGFPPGHPPMASFLGAPVGIGASVIGNLYLAEKPGGFDAHDESVITALAAAAAVAVQNARLYEGTRRREAWVAAAQEVSTTILGDDEEDALDLIARRSRELAEADVAALVLPGRDGDWLIEVTDGVAGTSLIGSRMPAEGLTAAVLSSGSGRRVARLGPEKGAAVAALRPFGPAIFAPLVAGTERMGVLLLMRTRDAAEFTDDDLTTAQTFAGQAALAMQLAEARRRAEDAELLEQRQRIARDLHDLVVQELFALGIRLGRLRADVSPSAASDIDVSLLALDRVVGQIRSTISSLRDARSPAALTERLLAETTAARNALGFAPSLHVHPSTELVDAAVGSEVADDIVAVLRETLANTARHAGARAVSVDLTLTQSSTATGAGAGIALRVLDDGRGPGTSTRRSGLANLAERARQHGGTFEVLSASPRGTAITWCAPIPQI